MERPLFIILAPMIAGLIFGVLSDRIVPLYFVLPLAVAVLFTLFISQRTLFVVMVSLFLFCSANSSLHPYLYPAYDPGSIANYSGGPSMIVEGVVSSRPVMKEYGWQLTLDAEKILFGGKINDVDGSLLLTVQEGAMGVTTGDRIRFSSRIKRPRNYGLPGEFDRVRALALKGIYAKAFVRNSSDILFMGDSGFHPFHRRIDLAARRLGEFITLNTAPEEGSVLRALLLGDKGGVPSELRKAYTTAGVNHILSISGFHVGIIALFLFQMLIVIAKGSESIMLKLNIRRISLALTLPFIVFYLFLSGTAPSTLRAVIMVAVYITAMFMEQQTDPLDSLMLAAILILSISPPALFDLSFQLSFTAIWGIIALTPILAGNLDRTQGKTTKILLLFVSASMAAIMATMIPVAYYFHRASAAGVISNLLIVPLLGYGAVIIGFSALPFVHIAPPLAVQLYHLASYMVRLADEIILWLAKIPLLPLFHVSPLQLAISYLFLASMTFIKEGRSRRFCMLSLALIFIASFINLRAPNKGKIAMTFFSLGQGESTLVNFPDGKTMLIDGGGNLTDDSWDIGESLLAPALWELGVDSIDYLVLTHPHPDHIKGLYFIAENFSIGQFWQGGSYPENMEYGYLTDVLNRRGIPIRTLNTATPPIAVGGATIEIVSPMGITSPKEKDYYRRLNDDSLVFRIAVDKFSALFTGDIGSDVEARLVDGPRALRCTLLKLPHHGSRFSSSIPFLTATSPRIAVVSVGFDNVFNLPSPGTLARLNHLGIRLYRTDLDGTIRVEYATAKEGAITVRTMGHFH